MELNLEYNEVLTDDFLKKLSDEELLEISKELEEIVPKLEEQIIEEDVSDESADKWLWSNIK